MRSGSLIIINGKSSPYFELSEEERLKIMQGYFNNCLIAIAGYVLLRPDSHLPNSPSFGLKETSL